MMEAAQTPDTAAGANMRRRLTVVLAADVVGYSRLVADDDEDTLQRFGQAAAIFADLVTKHHGRVFSTAGDAILAEFLSAVDATRCAIEFQEINNAEQSSLPPPRQLRFRMGIAMGDVVVTAQGNPLGDPVNIAARLESIAAPGGICISEDVRSHVLNKLRLAAVDLGEQKLRNIPRPIRVFKLVPAGRADSSAVSGRRFTVTVPRVWLICALVAVIAGVLILLSSPRWLASPQRFTAQGVSKAANTARPFDARVVPLVIDRVRASLADFEQQPDFKAIAISHSGWGVASGAADAASAEREAIDRCKKRDPKGDCKIYAVGNMVVAPPLPLPSAADLHAEPLEMPLSAAEVADIRGMPSAAGLEAFLKQRDHKALAISENGFSSIANRADRTEAVRLAVERCSDFARVACLLISVDGFVTVRIPHARRAVRPYVLAGDNDMSDADRQAVGQIYAGRDWRALVRGGTGHWYAVSARESESAAVEDAMGACRAAERDCTLRALGNFRVEEPR
jgi:class 3 adenylate cyclase